MIRPYHPSDRAFLVDSFASSASKKELRLSSKEWALLSTRQRMQHTQEVRELETQLRRKMELYLDNPESLVLVSCDPSDPDFILGYLLGTDKGEIAWVYVKEIYRTDGKVRDELRAHFNPQLFPKPPTNTTTN